MKNMLYIWSTLTLKYNILFGMAEHTVFVFSLYG